MTKEYGAYILREKGRDEVLGIIFKDSLQKAFRVIETEKTTLQQIGLSIDLKNICEEA